MSVTQRPETLNSQHVQVWDNAAFDNGEPEAIKLSWSNLNPVVSANVSESFESKENQCPPMASPVSTTSSASLKPLHPNSTITNTQTKIPSVPEDKRLDSEIEAIEKEINRLSSRLESLKLEKAKRTAKTPGKIAPLKTPRRGLSMGPAEMMMTTRGVRRGISIGPAEIYSATKLKQLGKQEITSTPIPPPSSRRKSCYWKLQDIDELRVAKEIRGKSLTLSPKSRNKTRVQPAAATTTIGSKKSVKKDEGIISSIQPKKLFTSSTNEGEKSGKKPLKNGRVVPSRYTQISNSGIRKRRSLSESNDEDSKRKRASLAGTSRVLTTAQKSVEDKTTTTTTTPLLSVSKRLNVRTFRSVDESPSPRDSGPAKRVSQLVGRKSYFSMDDEEEEMPVFSFEVDTAEEEN